MVGISASILAADLASIRTELATVETADRIHIDIMDGHFVPNISLGFSTVESIAACTDLPIDLHLMVSNPEEHSDRLTELDVSSITIHAEISGDVPAILKQLRHDGVTPGIAVNPDTEIEALEPVSDAASRLTIMGVYSGFSGQSFIPDTIKRIERTRELFTHRIEVDGGIDPTVSGDCIRAGADIVVSGSTIFDSPDREQTIRQLRESTG